MKKQLLTVSGAALIILNIGVFFCPDPSAKPVVFTISALLGILVVILGRWGVPARSPESKDAGKPANVPMVVPPVAPAAPVRAEAEVVAFLGLLQEHGRLVDFVSEDISGADDAQIGSAARVVHAGCAKVLREHFTIEPVRTEDEGAEVILEAGYETSQHRLLGSVAGQPPYQGKLLHPGWKATKVKLPQITGTSAERPWPVVAPAEVQVKS